MSVEIEDLRSTNSGDVQVLFLGFRASCTLEHADSSPALGLLLPYNPCGDHHTGASALHIASGRLLSAISGTLQSRPAEMSIVQL